MIGAFEGEGFARLKVNVNCGNAAASPVGLPTIGNQSFGMDVTGSGSSVEIGVAFLGATTQSNTSPCSQVLINTPLIQIVKQTVSGAAFVPLSIPNDPSLLAGLVYFRWIDIANGGSFYGVGGASDVWEISVGL